uniref:Acriflavin resistance protein n=1 Tax=uncultured bacterium UPO46 TaxID=1776971 RepID=A0A126SY50_9BACT|nr:acriflavin resistance protein [uncultured bacterium UPO46]
MIGLNLAALAVRERAVTLFFILLTTVVGVYSFFSLGRAEDPVFTVRLMMVSAVWPGASAQQMQDQVADRLEKRLQDVEYLDKIETTSRPGRVDMLIEMKDSAPENKVNEFFYQVRKRMQDEAPFLPPGTQGPFINDEFSDVYFSLYALSAPGMPPRLLAREAERLRSELLRVKNVQKVRILGEQSQRVFIDLDQRQMAGLGVQPAQVIDALDAYNRLLPAGIVETRGPRLYWRVDADLADLDTIRAVPVRVGARIVRLGDIARIERGYEDPPSYMIRVNGKESIVIGTIMHPGEDGLALGNALDATHDDLVKTLPAGMTFEKYIDQGDVIGKAVNLFQVKFLIAVVVVMLISFLTLGFRAGLIVGIAVPLTLGITFLLMQSRGLSLDRISLGALIIALGLLVDDAIIAIEMMLVKMNDGWDRVLASSHIWHATAAPMLSGTLITVIGFLPIGFAQSIVREYAGSTFWVLGFALLASWLVAVVFTPYLGVILLQDVKKSSNGSNTSHSSQYDTTGYRQLRSVIEFCMRQRMLIIVTTIALFLVSTAGLALVVKKQFFPNSDRSEVLVTIFLPDGTGIAATDAVVKRIENILRSKKEISSLASYIGAGAPRFFLSINPEAPNPSFAKIVAMATSLDARDKVLADIQQRVDRGEFPEARIRVHQLLLGPPVVWPVSFRILGPDPQVLRRLAGDVQEVMSKNAYISNPHLEWSERVPAIRLNLDMERLRAIGLTPRDLANQLQLAWGGVSPAELREDIRNVYLTVRIKAEQNRNFADTPIKTLDGHNLTLAQAGLIKITTEDPVLMRYNRTPFIAVHADAKGGAQASDLIVEVWKQLTTWRENLPAGYWMEIAGTGETSSKTEASIQKLQPVMLGLMMLIIMLQMRSFSGTFMVLATAPLGVIGATLALIVSNKPFGFVALLGLIGLAGILMRNTLILTKQIDDNLEAGMAPWPALREATVQRARPVVLTAVAAALAFVPLTTDAQWGPMAFVLIGGTLVGTLITLFFLPALYSLWFKVRPGTSATA